MVLAMVVLAGCKKEKPADEAMPPPIDAEKPADEAVPPPIDAEKPADEAVPLLIDAEKPADVPKSAVTVNVKTAEVEAKLAKADLVDGTADKVVSKCAGCALAMDGKSENALKVSGYTIHFCSDGCKKGFEEDTTKSILAMTIPEG